MCQVNKPFKLTASRRFTPWEGCTPQSPRKGLQVEEASYERTGTAWLNSPPLTAAGLRGKVALVGFWTYTCVNWLRQLPYLRAWAEKYSGHALVMIGVHTPEFSFERNAENVRWAVAELGVDYPVTIDNDYAVWLAFDNRSWPALYFADARGRHGEARARCGSGS
jgi:thiol-disulfide isomerase/thioredoxin